MSSSYDAHTKECLAASVIAAIQNLRDMEGVTDFDFRIMMQDNKMLTEADGYLSDGTMTCTCGAFEVKHCMEIYNREGVARAQALATAYLQDRRMEPSAYMWLVAYTEGRRTPTSF